eukprot:TRINITY_DN31602_c0_g1_i1.p1 TRINITY_DN31602_c0_g1~~TRINITY_DN31602_c0_g1_i1.p1  ORF type:complete len:358 (-),score=40.18 TRINITY_DN31602_c0_g1_i1:129-1202(-)
MSGVGSRGLQVAYNDEDPEKHLLTEVTEDDDSLSDSDGEYKDIRLPLKADSYDGLLYTFAAVADGSYAEAKGHRTVCCFQLQGVILYILSFAAQSILVFLIWVYSNERAQDPYEGDISKETAALRNAMSVNKTLPSTDRSHVLCEGDHSVPYSQSLVIFIWVCRNLPDLTSALWGIRMFLGMPTRKEDEASMINLADSKSEIRSAGLPLKIKSLVLIQLPKLVITFLLISAGMTFLMYCKGVGIMVMKAIGMSYVLTVDDIIFQGLSSRVFQDHVTKCTLVLRAKASSVDAFNIWGSMIMKTVITLAIVLWFCRIHHWPLQEFREVCIEYKYKFEFPECEHGVSGCGLSIAGFQFAN